MKAKSIVLIILSSVITEHLLTTVKYHAKGELSTRPHQAPNPTPTLVLTYNVRGVGGSHGSSAWVTPGSDPADLAALEKWAAEMMGGGIKEIKRFVGCRVGVERLTLCYATQSSDY